LAINLKNPRQIEKMREAGRVVRKVLDALSSSVRPGVSTLELDEQAERICSQEGAQCLFKGVPGHGSAGPFPGNICASINQEIVHGIPSADRRVKAGDILSVDFGVRLDGWCGDAAETFIVGDVPPRTRKLVNVTKETLALAIEMCRPGIGWSEIAAAMQENIESQGFSVVREFVGHGIGKKMHEDPKIPNWLSPDIRRREIPLRPGMVLAIEPMVNEGSHGAAYGPDGWTIVTRDGKPSAHFEQTVAITEDGCSVLTIVE
jgi:methionyl aminopeptidase